MNNTPKINTINQSQSQAFSELMKDPVNINAMNVIVEWIIRGDGRKVTPEHIHHEATKLCSVCAVISVTSSLASSGDNTIGQENHIQYSKSYPNCHDANRQNKMLSKLIRERQTTTSSVSGTMASNLKLDDRGNLI